MNPGLNRDMIEIPDFVKLFDECKVLLLTGIEPAFSAGMDLKQYFKEMDDFAAGRSMPYLSGGGRLVVAEASPFLEAYDGDGQRMVPRRGLRADDCLPVDFR